jgi:hypothetical protein
MYASLMKRTPPGQTLTPTALVHEAYLRLVLQRGRPLDARHPGRAGVQQGKAGLVFLYL